MVGPLRRIKTEKGEIMKTTSNAWAIKSKLWDDPEPFLLGVFYCNSMRELESYQDGMRTCLFRTRQQARTTVKGFYYKQHYRVVKVQVTIEEIGR
jgi:hypothetical protein